VLADIYGIRGRPFSTYAEERGGGGSIKSVCMRMAGGVNTNVRTHGGGRGFVQVTS
jgi:hypothetical protein